MTLRWYLSTANQAWSPNIVGNITRVAKVIKEIGSDLNIFLVGGLFRGERWRGAGETLEGDYLSVHPPFCWAVWLDQLYGSGRGSNMCDTWGWRVSPNGLLTLTQALAPLKNPDSINGEGEPWNSISGRKNQKWTAGFVITADGVPCSRYGVTPAVTHCCDPQLKYWINADKRLYGTQCYFACTASLRALLPGRGVCF